LLQEREKVVEVKKKKREKRTGRQILFLYLDESLPGNGEGRSRRNGRYLASRLFY